MYRLIMTITLKLQINCDLNLQLICSRVTALCLRRLQIHTNAYFLQLESNCIKNCFSVYKYKFVYRKSINVINGSSVKILVHDYLWYDNRLK